MLAGLAASRRMRSATSENPDVRTPPARHGTHSLSSMSADFCCWLMPCTRTICAMVPSGLLRVRAPAVRSCHRSYTVGTNRRACIQYCTHQRLENRSRAGAISLKGRSFHLECASANMRSILFLSAPTNLGRAHRIRRGLRDSDIAISILPWIERGGHGAPKG
jgi:hypothetical protein